MRSNLARNIKISGLATIFILILFCDFIEAQTDAQIMHMHRATRRRTAIVVSSVTHEKDQEAYEQQQKQEEQQQQNTETTQSDQTTQTQKETTTKTTPPPTKTTDGTLPIGTVVTSLPEGCKSTSVNDQAYYECGGNYYRTAFQGNNLVYVTTDPPK